jgi:toxin ParE1/3/4
LTEVARSDLEAIRDYGNDRFGRDAADRYFMSLDAAFALLEDYPLAAPAKPEWGTAVRCLTHRRHRLLYQVKGDEVVVLRVLHHARDVAGKLKP